MKEKIQLLESLLNKACNNIEYAVNVAFGSDKEETIKNMKSAIKTTTDLFIKGNINNLDLSVRNQIWNYWENILDNYLSMFPEYEYSTKKVR